MNEVPIFLYLVSFDLLFSSWPANLRPTLDLNPQLHIRGAKPQRIMKPLLPYGNFTEALAISVLC